MIIFFLSFIKCIQYCHLFQIIMVGFPIQVMILFPVGVRVFGNTIRVFYNHQIVLQDNMFVLDRNIYFGDIIPTLGLEHGPNLFNQHQGLNHLIQLLQLHHGGGSPGIILLHSDQLSSLHVTHTFISNDGLNCVTNFMSCLYVSAFFLPNSFLYYVHQQFLLSLASMMSFITSIARTFGEMHLYLVMIHLGSLPLSLLMVKLGVWILLEKLKVGVSIAGSLQIPLCHFYLIPLMYFHHNRFGLAFLVLIK